jgi:hypothetical protein
VLVLRDSKHADAHKVRTGERERKREERKQKWRVEAERQEEIASPVCAKQTIFGEALATEMLSSPRQYTHTHIFIIRKKAKERFNATILRNFLASTSTSLTPLTLSLKQIGTLSYSTLGGTLLASPFI